MKAAFEVVRSAIEKEYLAPMIHDVNDKLDEEIQFVLSTMASTIPQTCEVTDISSQEQSHGRVHDIPLESSYFPEPFHKSDVCDKISIFWPLMDLFQNGQLHKPS